MSIHRHTALRILHRKRTCTAGRHRGEFVVRRDGIICSSTGVQRLFQGLGDRTVSIRRGRQLQVCIEGIIAAADIGASRRGDAVATLADYTFPNPGREGTAFEATVLDDGTTAIACRRR